MQSRGIRGAITVENNTKEDIKEATVELINELIKQNDIKIEDISFAIFTLTKDLNADFPAKYARECCGFSLVPMMCYNELDVENSIKKCLRILINLNTDKAQKEIKHCYLKGASVLRQDISNK